MMAWRESSRVRFQLCSLTALLLVSSCAEVVPVDPALVEVEQRRILSPFQAEQTIVADKLELVMSANFWLNLVQPALSERLKVERKPQADGGKQVFWTNVGADHMVLLVDNTKFVIMRSAHIEVLGGRSSIQLKASAQGNVFFPRKGVDRKMVSEIVIENGSFRSR